MGRTSATLFDASVYAGVRYVCQDGIRRRPVRALQLLRSGPMEFLFQCPSGIREQLGYTSGHAQQGLFPPFGPSTVLCISKARRLNHCIGSFGRYHARVSETANVGHRRIALIDRDHVHDRGRNGNVFNIVSDPVSGH